MAHVVVSKVVKVTIGAAGGHKIAQILTAGVVVPDGVSEAQLEHLIDLGFIAELVVPEVESDEDRIAREQADSQAAFDEAVRIAAEKLVAEMPAAIVEREDGAEVPVGEDGLQILEATESDAAPAAKPARRTAK
ncbi:hypothetical protein EDF35_1932 [Rathayibacter sp. PhB151]|uniref:hypothetical protein n=1 Tax=Rathayibacter sp. PhB151 TaxID=2485189 RepID=UPI001062C4FD|nr:hypothetical protein [Rathayibacter sp. PhB151]TDX78718.1 hypothetical protein EDF35_1932 [Rathayibacter sp. PhB151]